MADNLFNPPKMVEMNLIGLNGNGAFLVSAFSREARKQGWTPEEIQKVDVYAKSGDYDHLVQVLMAHTEPVYDDEDEDDHTMEMSPEQASALINLRKAWEFYQFCKSDKEAGSTGALTDAAEWRDNAIRELLECTDFTLLQAEED